MKRIVISWLSILILFAAVSHSLSQETKKSSTPAPTTTPTGPTPTSTITPKANKTVTPTGTPGNDSCSALNVTTCCTTDGCGLYLNCASLDKSNGTSVCAEIGNYTGCNNTCSTPEPNTTSTVPPVSTVPTSNVTATEPGTTNATTTAETTTHSENITSTTAPVNCTGLDQTKCCIPGCVFFQNCTIKEADENVTVSGCQRKPDVLYYCNDLCLVTSTTAPATTIITESPDQPSTVTDETTTAAKAGGDCGSGFDGASFVGGMALSAALFIAGIIGYKVYTKKKENRYRQF